MTSFINKIQVTSPKQCQPDDNVVNRIYINGEIESSENIGQFVDILDTINSANCSDKIYIYINTEGGNLFDALQITHAINMCKGEVITICDSKVMSAGVCILMAGHKIFVHPNSVIYIHSPEFHLSKRRPEFIDSLKFTDEFFRNLYFEYFNKLLCEKSLSSIYDIGKDRWMSGKKLIEIAKEKNISNIYDASVNYL